MKPAEVRAEPETIAAPGQESAELPRGVSAPQPDARDTTAETNTEPARSNDLAVPKASSKPKPAAAAPNEAPQLAAKPTAQAVKPVRPAVSSKQPQREPVVEPVAPEAPPPPPPPPKVSVIVPHTDHVHVDVPAGLQHWLDEDDRMRPWLSKAVNVADSCYAGVREDEANAAGVIAFTLTMHENARPSGSVSSVTGPIKSIVMCATTRLLGVKMPLFTGKEGETYTVRVRFDP